MQEVVQALISEYGGSKLHKGSRLLRCKLGLIVGGGAGTHEDKAARRTELMKLQEMHGIDALIRNLTEDDDRASLSQGLPSPPSRNPLSNGRPSEDQPEAHDTVRPSVTAWKSENACAVPDEKHPMQLRSSLLQRCWPTWPLLGGVFFILKAVIA